MPLPGGADATATAYAKKVADADSLMAVVIAQAMNHGNQVMARTSDIPYHVLESTYQQYLRQATLHAANDGITNAGALHLTGVQALSPHHIVHRARNRFEQSPRLARLTWESKCQTTANPDFSAYSG